MIYVDSREPDYVLKVVKRQGVKFVVKKLDAGDFANEKQTVACERKRPEEVWNRVLSKTWDKQCQNLQAWALDTGTVPWLLIEGTFEAARARTKGKMPVLEAKGAVISAAVRYGVSVWYCEDLVDLVDIAIRICRKADENKLGIPKVIPFAKHVTDSRVGIVMNVCRVSARQAAGMLKVCGSVAAVLQAPESRLKRAPNVGPATARKVWRLLHKTYK